MDLSFFVRGLLIGFSIAATVGPMCILCIQRTLHKGQIYGLVSGLGIATADAVYGSIAAFGLTLITNFLVNQQGWVRLIGGLFLIYLGLKILVTKPAERAATAKANGYFGAYASTLLLTLTNPLTILSFAAIFAGIGVGGANKSSIDLMVVYSDKWNQPVAAEIYSSMVAMDQSNIRHHSHSLRGICLDQSHTISRSLESCHIDLQPHSLHNVDLIGDVYSDHAKNCALDQLAIGVAQ